MAASLAPSLAATLLLGLLASPVRAQLPEWQPYGDGSCELIVNHWQRVGDLWTTVEQCRNGRQQRLAISCAQGQITRESEVPRLWRPWIHAHGSDLALLRSWCPRLAGRREGAQPLLANPEPLRQQPPGGRSVAESTPVGSSDAVVSERTRRAAEVQRTVLGFD